MEIIDSVAIYHAQNAKNTKQIGSTEWNEMWSKFINILYEASPNSQQQ